MMLGAGPYAGLYAAASINGDLCGLAGLSYSLAKKT